MLAPLLALAIQVNDDLSRGSALYAECKAYLSLIDHTQAIGTDSGTDGGLCIGYVTGFMDGGNFLRGFCTLISRNGTAVRVYIAYMDKHPKLFDEPKSAGLELALEDAYPCPVKK